MRTSRSLAIAALIVVSSVSTAAATEINSEQEFLLELNSKTIQADPKTVDAFVMTQRLSNNAEVRAAANKASTSAEEKATTEFKNYGFDAGLSVFVPLGDKPIRAAELTNGKVNVTKHADSSIAPVLQLHKFITMRDETVGYGLFSSVGIGDDTIVKNFAVGLMVGIRTDRSSPQSINIGVGYYWEPNAVFLAKGFEDGEDAPAGATKAETVERTAKGLTVCVSYRF